MKIRFKNIDKAFDDLVDILLQVKTKMTDSSDYDWTYFKDATHARNGIDKLVESFRKREIKQLQTLEAHFAPTSAFQEHSMQNNWSNEYLKLADRVDSLCKFLKKHNNKRFAKP